MLQLLPMNEMAPGQQSPYSAISAMAIDPIFICVCPTFPEFAAAGGEAMLAAADRELLERARRAPAVDFAAVRRGEAGGARRVIRMVRSPASGATIPSARAS